jgi:hypothetical protein
VLDLSKTEKRGVEKECRSELEIMINSQAGSTPVRTYRETTT